MLRCSIAGILVALVSLGPAAGVSKADHKHHIKLNKQGARALEVLRHDRDPRHRAQALQQLARGASVSLMPMLAYYAAYDPDRSVREAASHAIGWIRGRDPQWRQPGFPRFDNDRNLLAPEYRGDSDRIRDAHATLDRLRNGRQSWQRLDAVRDLARLGGASVISALAYAAAYDADVTVRNAAGRALARLRGQVPGYQPPQLPPYQVDQLNQPALPGVDQSAQLIQNCMMHYLGRPARPDELRSWEQFLNNGGNYEQMLISVLASDEYYQRCGSNPATFITHLFKDAVRRDPSVYEMQIWVGYLGQFGGNRTHLLQKWMETGWQAFLQAGYQY